MRVVVVTVVKGLYKGQLSLHLDFITKVLLTNVILLPNTGVRPEILEERERERWGE